MGSFTNQPDFAVRVQNVGIGSDDITPKFFLNKAALYIGTTPEGGGNVCVMMLDSEGHVDQWVFKNVQPGTFMPICVDYVLKTETTASDIIAYW